MKKADLSKVLNYLNKVFCDNRIKYRIIFPSKIINPKRKDKGTTYGYYRVKDKTIAILKDTPMIDQLDTLIHEFTHAYQHQVLGQKLNHNKKGGELMKKFTKEIDKILKISVKKVRRYINH